MIVRHDNGMAIETQQSVTYGWWRWKVYVPRTNQTVYSGQCRTEEDAIRTAQQYLDPKGQRLL